MTSARAELFPLASFIFALESGNFSRLIESPLRRPQLSTMKTLPYSMVTGEELIMRPHIHIKLTESEQAYVATWKGRVFAVYGFAVMALLATVLFQHLFEQNAGSVARNSPPALAENTSPAAPQ